MSGPVTHLVERVAARLRGEAGLAAGDAALAPEIMPDGDAAPPRPDPSAQARSGPPVAAEAAPSGAPDGLLEAPAGDGFLDLAALRRGGLALAGVRSRVTEEYRITVGRVLRALRGANRNGPGAARPAGASLAMVTSARPGEGKTFSALNLAASVAQNGLAEVILVDVDAKPRSLSALLGLRDRAGLLDLADQPGLRAEELLVRTAVEGLTVLTLGTAHAATADAGVTRALTSAIERLRRRFSHHVILLDTAPCLSTSDPSTLAPLVDQVIMVVEAGRTQRSELGAAMELVRACPNIILVLNKVRLTHRHSFGSYYYFGYPS